MSLEFKEFRDFFITLPIFPNLTNFPKFLITPQPPLTLVRRQPLSLSSIEKSLRLQSRMVEEILNFVQ